MKDKSYQYNENCMIFSFFYISSSRTDVKIIALLWNRRLMVSGRRKRGMDIKLENENATVVYDKSDEGWMVLFV